MNALQQVAGLGTAESWDACSLLHVLLTQSRFKKSDQTEKARSQQHNTRCPKSFTCWQVVCADL